MLGRRLGNQSANKSTGSNYVKFKHIAQDKLKMRSQEASQYIEGFGMDIPGLGKDLRWLGDPNDQDNLEVHHEDADEFIKRVKKHKEENTETSAEDDRKDPLHIRRI